jgi:hypothetical protein
VLLPALCSNAVSYFKFNKFQPGSRHQSIGVPFSGSALAGKLLRKYRCFTLAMPVLSDGGAGKTL